MNVTSESFEKTLTYLSGHDWLSLDTETTGLRPYHGDRLFSVVIATSGEESFYFNFNEYEDIDPLPDTCKKGLFEFLALPRKWFLHNAKFDMHMLLQEGVRLSGFIHDSMIVGRLLENTRQGFSLKSLLKDIGLEKDDGVKKYIEENKECRSVVRSEHRKANETLLHYPLVPFEIMHKYASMDGCGTYALGRAQRQALEDACREIPPGATTPLQAYNIEAELLKVVVEMEHKGVQVDMDFCKRAAAYELSREKTAQEKFKEITGTDFVNSSKTFTPIFEGKEELTYTEKGNVQFSSDVLEDYKSPEAKLILEARKHKSSANFYLSFLDYASKRGVIHAYFNQSGTSTGRFSSSSPNLQNLTKEEGKTLEQEFVVRRAFVPRADYFFALADYDQMEYRLMLDAAKANDLIDKILGGLDVHQATADIAGITRKEAKTVNFGILYGQGKKALAESLGISIDAAEGIKSKIFDASPEIKTWIDTVVAAAKMKRRTIKNWCGFLLRYHPYSFMAGGKEIFVDPAYKAPNGWVQGGCAYVMKLAMIKIHQYLADKKSSMVMTIHDELVLEVHKEEVYILPKIKEIMESIYPSKRLPLTTGMEHSFKSLADKVDGCPSL